MENSIRLAHVSDVMEMVALSEQFRLTLQEYQPIFWRKAEASREMQTIYFEKLMDNPEIIVLVAEGSANLEGFLIAMRINAPPVYQPDGSTYLIDDFCVKSIKQWHTVGKALLRSAVQEIQGRDGGQIVVVCPHLLQEKRTLLQHEGLTIASEWYVKTI